VKTVTVKQARQTLARLIENARRGGATAITRRGRKIAQIAPLAPSPAGGFPDLTSFRSSLGATKTKPAATMAALRRAERA
jgi:antitoxin (DNA-binding transcriptional repressor) of toxin-antitoxin stability system